MNLHGTAGTAEAKRHYVKLEHVAVYSFGVALLANLDENSRTKYHDAGELPGFRVRRKLSAALTR